MTTLVATDSACGAYVPWRRLRLSRWMNWANSSVIPESDPNALEIIAGRKMSMIVCGWALAASISEVVQSCRRPSILCMGGMETPSMLYVPPRRPSWLLSCLAKQRKVFKSNDGANLFFLTGLLGINMPIYCMARRRRLKTGTSRRTPNHRYFSTEWLA